MGAYFKSSNSNKMKAIFILLFPLLITGGSLCAQSIERSVIAALGASAEAGNVQLEYTAGEAVVLTLSSEETTLTQGFHQGRSVYRYR